MKRFLVLSMVLFSLGCTPTSPTSPLIGDVNHDGVVDSLDLNLVRYSFGSRSGGTNWNQDADINGDGRVDGIDLHLVSTNMAGSRGW